VFASSAFADIDGTPTPTLGTSSSNPGAGSDFWWRQNWGNTLYPDFELNPPTPFLETSDGYLLGTLYNVDRSWATAINPMLPSTYYRDTFPTGISAIGGTNTNSTLDLLGIYQNPPAGGWPLPTAGMSSVLEGQWYYHYKFYSDRALQAGQWTIPFGVDLTPPTAVTGLHIRTGLTTSDVTTWTPSSRAIINWDPAAYDKLSGVGYYQVLIDDKPYIPETSATPPAEGRVYTAPWLVNPETITIESMPPGAHKVGIQPVDRATNAGPATSAWFYSDPDTPTVSWAIPSGTVLDPRTRTISVNASDAAGDPQVVIRLAGSAIATLTAPPYTITPNLSALATGTYTLSATVTDHLNHTAVISKSVTWNPFGLAGSTISDSLDVTGTPATSSQSAETSTGGGSGWTNNLFPLATLNSPADATDIFYSVTQTPGTIDVGNLQNYYHSLRPDGTLWDQTVNLKDTAETGGPWAAGPAGSVAPYEGTWYVQWVWYNNSSLGVSSAPYRLKFNVDRTPPAIVTGFTATPTAGAWTSAQRVNLTWTGKEYDALSGDATYQIYLDDQPKVSTSATNAISSATIEDMPAGQHKLSIAAIDRAGNVGPKANLTFQSDTDTPTIAWTSPTSALLTPANHTFSVDAADAAGDPTVVFKLDNGISYVATVTAPPYTVSPDLSALSVGPHTLSAAVTDKLGRKVTISKAVTWNAYDGSLDTTAVAGTSPASGVGVWTNSLYPVVTLQGISGGITYNVVQTPATIDTLNPNNYYHSTDGAGPLTSHMVDLKDTIDFNGPWAAGPAGSVAPYEGTWYFQWKWHGNNQFSATTYRLPFNVDLTPPTAVAGLTSTPAPGAWTSSQRVKLNWTNAEYDALSKTSYYQLYLDDNAWTTVSRTETVPNSLTIENFAAGKHKVSIAAVDNAGNIGPKTSILVQSDPDVPTIEWTSPTDTSLNPANSTFSVDATDAAGDPTVVFQIDGGVSLSTTLTARPYTITPDLSGLSAGPHTLSAVVIDKLGRTVSAGNKSVTWNSVRPLVSDDQLDITFGSTLAESKSNPSLMSEQDSWWRQGWGNSLTPDFELNPPVPYFTSGLVSGTMYSITTSPADLNTSTPEAYYRAARGIGTNMDQTIDMQGVFNYPPVGGWRSAPLAGTTTAIEGPWYMNLIWLSSIGHTGTQTYHIPMGIDITPPSAVESMVVSPSQNSADATGSISTSRIYISWTPKQYDSLSGVAYYQVLIDGVPVVPEGATNPKQGRVYNLPGAPANSATLENMPAGKHTIGIAAVDRATNMGPEVSKVIWSDPDTPTVTWKDPAGTVIDPRTSMISVNASDRAGDPVVTLSIGSTATPVIATLTTTTPPYEMTPNLSALATGTYTITARARDHWGRTTTISKQVTWSPHGIAGSTTDPSVDVTGTPGTSPDSADNETGWTNNLYPIATLSPPGGSTDVFYNVVQTKSPIDVSSLQNYDHSVRPDGTLLDQSISLGDVIDAGKPWAVPGPAGSVAPYEGTWYFQWVWYNRNTLGVSPQTYNLKFNIDRTPPTAVTGFASTPAAGSWTTSRRAKLTWNTAQYDALSGVYEYRLFLDDSLAVTVNATSALSGSATIENMPAGKHKVSIAAVDKAGNVGPKSNISFQSDWDTPSIEFTEPTSTITPAKHTVSVNATDGAGDPTVILSISGGSLPTPVILGTLTSPPYTVTPNFAAMGMADGSYTLHATAIDMTGHTKMTSRDVTWDTSNALITNPEVDLEPGALIGTSRSNPSATSDADAWWRQGWGNSLTPDFELAPPAPNVDDVGFVVGTLYDVSTNLLDINTATPDLYYRSTRGTGANLNQTIDLQGVFNYPPVGGWRPTPVVGASQTIEGPWYMNLTWFTSKGYSSSRTYHIPMGIDVTNPSMVDSMVVSPTLNSLDATSVIPTSRIHISWANKSYDTLSGVGYYQVLIDGSTVIPDSPSNPPQGRVFNIPGAAPSGVTIEDLSPGRHEIGIQAVDRATNKGKVATQIVYCDPDVPTIKISSPSGTLIGVKPTVGANASDLGGITKVVFKLDGTPLSTVTSWPYQCPVDLSAFASGDHVLEAVATDKFGREASDRKSVRLDKTPLVLSSIKTAGSGRKVTVTYKISRPGSVKFSLKIPGYSKTVTASKAGTYSFVYTYPKASKSTHYPSSTSFYDNFTISASDSLGNTASASGRVKCTLSKIVRVSASKVRIIYY
jgi:hypothetical protein